MFYIHKLYIPLNKMIQHRSWTSFKTSAHKNPDGKPINLSRPSYSVVSSCFIFKSVDNPKLHLVYPRESLALPFKTNAY